MPQDTLPGPLTAYTQQYNILHDADDLDPRPRRQFIIDLTKEINKKQAIGNLQIIVGIDANEII